MHHLDMFHILTMLQIYIIHRDVSERCQVKQPIAQPRSQHRVSRLLSVWASVIAALPNC